MDRRVGRPDGAAASSSNPTKGELIAKHARGRFSGDVQAALSADPGLVAAIASRILERHFLESLHQDILNSVGLSLETTVTRRKRDPAFRHRVLSLTLAISSSLSSRRAL
jgi:putative restriction endonuclease